MIRPYEDLEGPATHDLFRRAVMDTARRDYTDEQVEAWAGAQPGLVEWSRDRAAAGTIVAVIGTQVVGFTDLGEDGLIDMMFVDPDFSGQGIGSALLGEVLDLAEQRGLEELEVHASLTARPLFERHGFEVVARQRPVRAGVELTNFRMRRRLS